MATQQSIDQNERELKELLHRVMIEPLGPINNSVQEVDKRLNQIEDLVEDLRRVELAAISQSTDDSRKQFRSLKSLTEETPREVQNALQPLLEQGFDGLSQSQQSTLEQMQKHLEQSAMQSASHLAATLVAELIQQAKQYQQSLAHLHESLKAHTEQIKLESNSALEKSTQEIRGNFSNLSESLASLHAIFTEQSKQINQLQQEQNLLRDQLPGELSQLIKPIKTWVISTALIAGAGLIVGVVFALQQKA